MKNLLSILILVMAVQCASAIEYLTPVTYPDGSLYRLTNFFSANSNLLNAAVSHPEVSGSVGPQGPQGEPGAPGTNAVADAWKLGVSVSPISGSDYWVDFGLTNSANVRAIYRTILAEGDVNFIGFTNAMLNDIASFTILASGGNRQITFPPLDHLDTNRLTPSGSQYSLTLTNGHILIFTVQTNALTMTPLWNTPEQ